MVARERMKSVLAGEKYSTNIYQQATTISFSFWPEQVAKSSMSRFVYF